MTEKDSCEIQTLNMGCPMSKTFKQRYSYNQNFLNKPFREKQLVKNIVTLDC